MLGLRATRRDIPLEAGYAQARAAAERALALDATQSEAHTVLGRIADTHDWDFPAAEAHYTRAVEANPGDARAHSLRAWLLMRLGRREEALREARRAVELDPISMPAYNNLGAMYSYAGQEQRAAEAFQAGLALAPDAAALVANLALSYSDLGRHADAIRSAERALATLWAEPDASPYLIATAYAGLGDSERAFQMLEQAVKQRDDLVPDLGVDPVFNDLRGDPRMQRLLQGIGLQ